MAEFAPRPVAARAAAVVVGVEGAVLALAALFYVALGVVGDDAGRELSFGLGVVLALAGAGLLLLAKGLWHARRWAQSPAITWQILQGFVGGYLISEGELWVGIVLLGFAIVALGALVTLAKSAASAGQHLDGARDAVDDHDAAEPQR